MWSSLFIRIEINNKGEKFQLILNHMRKPVRGRFDKRTVFAEQVDDVWTADLIDMSPFSRSNKGYLYLLTVIDVFSKYGWIVPLKT